MTNVIGSQDDEHASLMAVDQYFRWVRWSPALTQEEEARLVEVVERGKRERMQSFPDARVLAEAREARDRLVESFQGLVIHIAKQMQHRFEHLELLDLIQEGNIGLLRAIEENDVSKGYPLRALAGACIRYTISDAWREQEALVRCSRPAMTQWVQLSRLQEQFQQEQGREPTLVEIAQATGYPPAEVFEIQLLRRWRETISLHVFVEEGERDEDEIECAPVFAAAAETGVHDAEVQQAMQEALTQRQRQVIALRYGLVEGVGQGMTHAEVAAQLGVSRSDSAHIEMSAEERLRQRLGGIVGLAVICCVVCGKLVPQRVVTRPRRYCQNNHCRWAARKLLQVEREVA